MANYLQSASPARGAKMKREVTGLLLDQSETICSAYLTGVFGYRNTVSSSLDISSLAFGAIGPLLSAGSTGPALSAAGTFFSDTNKTYLRSFYGDSDLSVVGRKIRADRIVARKAIEQVLKSPDSDLAKISFGSLSAEVQRYHDMCGLNYGIESLKAAAESSVARQEQENAPGTAPPPTPTDGDDAGAAGGDGAGAADDDGAAAGDGDADGT